MIGPNGSGKSTFLRISAGILGPDSGEVLLMGGDVSTMNRRTISKTVGYLPQNASGGEEFSAWHIVSLGRYAHLKGAGFLSVHDREVIMECMRKTEILDLFRRPFRQLSGGEKQRVLLASILAQEPDVLLLDEPESALDLHHRARFFSVLSDLAGKNLSIVLVTHDINTAATFCNRLIVMKDGRIIADGDTKDVLSQEILSEIYGDDVKAAPNPVTGDISVYLVRSSLESQET